MVQANGDRTQIEEKDGTVQANEDRMQTEKKHGMVWYRQMKTGCR